MFRNSVIRGSFTSEWHDKNFFNQLDDAPTVCATTSKATSRDPTRRSSLSISSPRALLVASVSVAAFMFRDFLSGLIITSLPLPCLCKCMREEADDDRDTWSHLGLHSQ